jgi:hypothetical protein
MPTGTSCLEPSDIFERDDLSVERIQSVLSNISNRAVDCLKEKVTLERMTCVWISMLGYTIRFRVFAKRMKRFEKHVGIPGLDLFPEIRADYQQARDRI